VNRLAGESGDATGVRSSTTVVGSKPRQACCSRQCRRTMDTVAQVDSRTQETCTEDAQFILVWAKSVPTSSC
jgi:hypothetical protein